MSQLFSKNLKGGFTLAEMVTVAAIIVIMTGVVLANFPDFRDRSSLELVAQEVALVIRQAQAFGINTRGVTVGQFRFPSYGVYFNIVSSASYPNYSTGDFVLFADDPAQAGIGYYDGAATGCGQAGSECREIYHLPGGLTIDSIKGCGNSSTPCGSLVALSDSGQPAFNVVFNRPNPEAKFVQQNGVEVTCGGSNPCSYAKIDLKSTKSGAIKSVYVWNTGHIYVK